MAAFPTFINGSYTSQSPIADQEETINWYVEILESEGATSRAVLYPTPGFEQRLLVSAVGGRAMFEVEGRAFGVVGSTFYEFFEDDTSVSRGTVAIDQNPATICSNGDGGGQLFITSGDKGYCYDLTSNVLTEELPNGATMGGMLYGFFVAFDIATSTFRISDLFDGETWDPLQFAQNSISQDNWKAMLVTPYGQILLLGGQTGQFWYNSGAFPFPFALDPSGLIEEGIASTFSLKQAGKSAVWLSTNKNGGYQVMRASGFTPQRISTHALEYKVSRYDRVDDAIGETYEDQGHAFYLLTFPSVPITHCYDFTTEQWHRRGPWISEDNVYDAVRPFFHCFAFNKHLVADRESGVIYQMDIAFTRDVEGRPIRRLRRSPAVVNQNLRLFFPSFELLFEAGLGTSRGLGVNPQFMLRMSDDGGKTWGNERQANAGRLGEYAIRAQWLRNGMARKRVYEVTCTDPVTNWRISEAYQRVVASTEAA